MKAILMSIRPQHLVNILNGEKTVELRKRFTKDYRGWVYLYCTKDKKYANLINRGGFLTGMVIARFWCDKVEQHKDFACVFPYSKLRYNKATCLDQEEIEDYGFIEGKGFVPLYAIHITKLEIFDKPKKLSDFSVDHSAKWRMPIKAPITKAPQSWQYIYIEEII